MATHDGLGTQGVETGSGLMSWNTGHCFSWFNNTKCNYVVLQHRCPDIFNAESKHRK